MFPTTVSEGRRCSQNLFPNPVGEQSPPMPQSVVVWEQYHFIPSVVVVVVVDVVVVVVEVVVLVDVVVLLVVVVDVVVVVVRSVHWFSSTEQSLTPGYSGS